MILKLYEVVGYKGTEPVLGHCVATYTGNQKQCTKQGKEFAKKMNVAWKWEK